MNGCPASGPSGWRIMSVTQSSTDHPSVRLSGGTSSGHVLMGCRGGMGNHLPLSVSGF